jgi:hypothetical protein
MKLPVSYFVAASFVGAAAASAGCFDGARHFHPDDWAFCQPVDEDGSAFFYYTPFEDEGNVMLGLHVPQDSFGWSALAIAGNGGMKGASQFVVRRDDDGSSEWIVEDRYSEDYVTPKLDESQDVKLIFANQTDDGETSFGILVPMNSCDEEHDYPIYDKDIFMHWALGKDHEFSFHGTRRGQFHANLLRAPKRVPSTEGLLSLDITMPNVPVNMGEGGTDPTNPYICSFFDLEELSQGRFVAGEKVHVTRFSPILDQQKYVHHMILYSCSGDETGQNDDDKEHLLVQPECESMPAGTYISCRQRQ